MFMDTSEHANCEHPADHARCDDAIEAGGSAIRKCGEILCSPEQVRVPPLPRDGVFFPRIMHHACVCVRVGVYLCVQRWLDLHTSCTAND